MKSGCLGLVLCATLLAGCHSRPEIAVSEQQPLVLVRNVFPGIPLCNDAMRRLPAIFKHLGRQAGQGMQGGREVLRALEIVGVRT